MSESGGLGLPQTVDVSNDAKVVQFVVAGKGHRLPHGALGHLTVTKDTVHTVATATKGEHNTLAN